ncbi:MDR family MFS transporter [Mesobacillus sp. AQ2]|jgi:EmrB/QacA subfamily drug resistance transporter|uniref:MDR family MFS transporter n=1 Tax=unclassified Mesobacillus TaxID=2675270 RepID=UPI00204265D3|nr:MULTISPECIES: MDR family MFS transporter [unclassified Mesobacillus]MCM3123492.1 MFS transporter [Mesobacillus sp. MER 33]MCM3233025.1 MFS transporter [Mesobacillus sp. MER 48]WHX42100.1 MDR family MFS transporter [Mesobacillus sp. AQ2]
MGQAEQKTVKKETKRPYVLATVMLAMFMGAVEGTIVSTAMPAIVGDLGGFALYSWVFSAYLLMNAVTVLIYGKLSDLFGRKPILTFGIIVFLIGSILSGTAETMEMLILYRFIQGFGAGAVMPIATTIVGDIYSREERAKVQGYLSSVWGISAVSGPALGGLLVEYASWRYVFWINVPLGILAIAGLWLYLHENIEKKKHKVDYPGAILLTISISSLMIVLVEAGANWAWTSPKTIGLISLSVLGFIFFILQEKRAEEPMMPFNIWREQSIFIANMTSLTTGVMLIGISSFLPAFVQGVMERSPIVAGFTLTAMSIGWPIASAASGRLLLSIGYRKTSLFGGASLILGSILFVTLTPEAGPLWAAAGSFFVGVGMGLTSTAFIVSIQSTVTWQQRGIATAANMFMRNLGNTVGAALLGGVLNSSILSYMKKHGAEDQDLSIDAANVLLNEAERQKLSAGMKTILQDALTNALHSVYIVVFIFAVVSLLFILFLPKEEKTAD